MSDRERKRERERISITIRFSCLKVRAHAMLSSGYKYQLKI